MKNVLNNWMSCEGDAIILADYIRQYWANLGFDVNVWLEKRNWRRQSGEIVTDYDIRSDLLNGLPQRRLERLAA